MGYDSKAFESDCKGFKAKLKQDVDDVMEKGDTPELRMKIAADFSETLRSIFLAFCNTYLDGNQANAFMKLGTKLSELKQKKENLEKDPVFNLFSTFDPTVLREDLCELRKIVQREGGHKKLKEAIDKMLEKIKNFHVNLEKIKNFDVNLETDVKEAKKWLKEIGKTKQLNGLQERLEGFIREEIENNKRYRVLSSNIDKLNSKINSMEKKVKELGESNKFTDTPFNSTLNKELFDGKFFTIVISNRRYSKC